MDVKNGTLQSPPSLSVAKLTKPEVRRALADHQVVRLAGSRVLQRQDGPVLGGAALAQLVRVLARLGQRDGLALGVADQLDRVVVVLVQAGRARVAVTGKKEEIKRLRFG